MIAATNPSNAVHAANAPPVLVMNAVEWSARVLSHRTSRKHAAHQVVARPAPIVKDILKKSLKSVIPHVSFCVP